MSADSTRPPIADALRRIEDAFVEGAERSKAEPSADAIRAAEALLFAGGAPSPPPTWPKSLGRTSMSRRC